MLPQKLNSERINPQNLYYMHYRMATVQTGPSGKCRQKVMTGIIIYNT